MKLKQGKFKYIFILISILGFLTFVFVDIKSEMQKCLGVPVISVNELETMKKQSLEIGNIILLEGIQAPYDSTEKNLYISCDTKGKNTYNELAGQLTCTQPQYNLFFMWEDEFNNLSASIASGHKFTLYAIDKKGNYMEYHVVFTTLPVLDVHGELIGVDEREREIFSGYLTVWERLDGKQNKRQIQKSNVEWHIRGNSSKSFLKKSWKLSLKDENGDNKNLSLAGLKKDDDYLLNSMWFDDVKVREKLAISLWNEMALERNSNMRMSECTYCEVVINDTYQGLRLLQNKIEKKYLSLDEGDYLYKGENTGYGECPYDVYEIIYADETNEDIIYAAMDDYFYQTDFSNLNFDNWIDLQILLTFGNMVDNYTYKNIFYVLQDVNGKEQLNFVPWDTDMSFGVYWSDGFKYMPESVNNVTYRMDYNAVLEQFPDVELLLKQRWQELRKTIFSEEQLLANIELWHRDLGNSGALIRDFYVLGWYSWGGNDTIEGLKSYIVKRLEVMDAVWAL